MRKKLQKTLVRPIALTFKYMQRKVPVEILLVDDTNTKLRGVIIGLDEFMNLTMDDVVEVNVKRKTEKKLGRLVLRQDSICLIHSLNEMNI